MFKRFLRFVERLLGVRRPIDPVAQHDGYRAQARRNAQAVAALKPPPRKRAPRHRKPRAPAPKKDA